MPPVLVGVDVGGTKTAVAVARDGAVLARKEGPGAAIRPGRAIASATVIAEVVRLALADSGDVRADVMVVGAAGAGREPERDQLRSALQSESVARNIVITTDIDVALAAAFGDGPGIVVSAGTGSVAVGRDRTGARHRMGGYGWQMGDEGSGYAIGRAALGAVSRAVDGRSPPTSLRGRVLEATRSESFDDLVRWAATATPAQIASLAPQVLAVAAQGDAIAQGIADYAARELSQLAICLLDVMELDGIIKVAITGGILAPNLPLRKAVEAKLKEEPGLAPLADPVDAAAGALYLAERA